MPSKVMVADDDEGILELVAATFGTLGDVEVLLARDGKEALDIVRREKPNIIFLDIQMPKMDGYEVCFVLKRDPATAPIKIVMLTGLADQFDRRRAMALGADDYFTKPFSPMALLEKVWELGSPHR